MTEESGSEDERDEDVETEWLFPSSPSSDSTHHDDDSAAETVDTGDSVAAFEHAAFGVDGPPASGTDSEPRTPAQSTAVPAFLTRASVEDRPRAGRSRKWLVVGAAIVALLVVGAVGVFAALERGDGTKRSSHSAATGESTTPASTSPTSAVTTTASTPSASGPVAFTVHSTCNGRDCEVAVRERPSLGAKKVGALHTGDVAQVTCSAQGDSVDDHDTGQRSDVWYRLAGTNGYSSSLYLQGPAVQACA